MWRMVTSGWTGTKREFVAKAYTTYRGIDAPLSLLKSCGLIRIVGWTIRRGRGAHRTAIYGWGGGEPDAPPPRKTTNQRFETSDSELVQRILQVLSPDPLTISGVAEAVGIHIAVSGSYLRIMRSNGLVHIARWERRGAHPPCVVYAAGPGIDAKKPRKRTTLEASRHRRRVLIERFGPERARDIMTSRAEGGVSRIVEDGKVVWERQAARVKRA
jgi:hypothetical protein